MGWKSPAAKKAYNRARYLANREAMQASHKAWNQRNPEKVKAYMREGQKRYAKAHPERVADRRRRHWQENREQEAASNKQWCDAHKAARTASAKAWREAHPGYSAQNARQWRLAHPDASVKYRESNRDRLQVNQQRHRAHKAALPNTLTVAQWQAIKAAYGHRCAYCGKRSQRLTQDHVLPVTKGGGTVASNIVPACGPCNAMKGTRPPPAKSLKLLLL